MMKTISFTLKFLAIDKMRRYARAIRDNVALSIGGVVALVLCAAFGIDALKANGGIIASLFPFVVIAYSAYKALQDYPMATIPYPMLSLKLFSHDSLIGYFLIKSIVPVIMFLCVWSLLGLQITQMLVVSLLLNIAANVYTAYKTQASSGSIIVVTAIILCCSLPAIVFAQVWLAFVAAVVPCVALSLVKSLSFDFILPYYESLYQIKTGFENKDSSMMAAGQSSFVRSAQKSTIRLAAEGYGRFFSYKLEAIRLVFRKKSFIVCSALILLGGASLALYFNYDMLPHLVATMLLFVVVDLYLLALDRGENHAGVKNPLLSTSTKSKIERNYGPHLLLVLYFFVLGIPVLAGLNPVLVAIAVILLPLQSILVSNAKGLVRIVASYSLMMMAFLALIIAVDPSGAEAGKLIQQMQGFGA